MGDDEVGPGWSIDPDTRRRLRVQRIRISFEDGDLPNAILEAEELLDEEPEHSEGLYLLAEAMLEAGDPEGAAQAYEQHLALPDPNPQALVGLAVARFDQCDLSGAVEAAREAVRQVPDAAEGHYTLGLALERLPGRQSEAVTAFASARQLDPEAYPFPLELADPEWEQAVRLAMSYVDPEIAQFWSGLTIRLVDAPDLDELRAADPPVPPTVSGLYDGEPPDDPTTARPTALRLFRRNLARAGSVEALVEQIARTLEHEYDDWMGGPPEDEPEA